MNENGKVNEHSVIVFIPLRSRQHFVPLGEINACVLADICNHTWIPECGYYEERQHTRLFIDECDMHEYNCDNNMSYVFTNYSQCFGAATCESLPSLLTRVQGFYIYYADGRRMMRYLKPEERPRHKTTYYTLPTIATKRKTRKTLTTLWKDRRRYTPWKTGSYKPWSDDTPPCAPCARKRTYVANLPRPTLYQYWPSLDLAAEMYARTPAKTKKKATKRTTKRTTVKPTTTKPTTQVFRTGTIGPIILNKATVWKDGKLVYKVIKGYINKAPIITTDLDSDFLE